MREKIYVTYTCKNSKCRKAFMDIDVDDSINDVPLKTRYCPDCVKAGFKNEGLRKRTAQEIKTDEYSNFFKEQIRAKDITDKRDVLFLKKEYNKNLKRKKALNQKVNKFSAFKVAEELLSYQDWKC